MGLSHNHSESIKGVCPDLKVSLVDFYLKAWPSKTEFHFLKQKENLSNSNWKQKHCLKSKKLAN